MADLISASVLSKSMVTYPLAFVPAKCKRLHFEDSVRTVRRLPTTEGLAKSVLYEGEVTLEPGPVAEKETSAVVL